jgi:hypothetical protein
MSIDWRNYDAFGKSSRYGGHLRHRHDGGLDHQMALHWVLHHRHGAALRDRLNLPHDKVADLLVRAAAMHPTNKQDNTMQNMTKTLREVGEHDFTKMIEKYAKTVHPTLTREQAFTKVFTEDSDAGRAIRSAYQIAKQGVADDDDDEDEDQRDGGGDDSRNGADDPLELLNRLAASLRREHPEWSREKCFAAVYTDPQYASLAKRERARYRPKA